MRKIFFHSFLLLSTLFSFGQARLVINNNAFIVVSNSAKVVLENPNTNALTIWGTGANIISEGQQNQIVWDIANNTGIYTIPWTTRPLVQGGNGTKIPMSMNITGAGSSDGIFNFSTYETATDMNTALPTFPSIVSSMTSPALGMADGSLYVVDRFWILDNSSYTTKPSATLSFNYDDAANEIAGTNLLSEANLRAQRWNSDLESWELLLFGSTNTATNITNNVIASVADFYPVWILVDLTVPLPVTLSSQQVVGTNCKNVISWATSSETNSSHFTILKSMDGNTWSTVGHVIAVGNSSNTTNYTFSDPSNTLSSLAYYKIMQYDLDGQSLVFETMTVEEKCSHNLEGPIVYPNPTVDALNINQVKEGRLEIIDATGRIIYYSNLKNGQNKLDIKHISVGMYTLNILSGTEFYQVKFVKE
jgi:hypothetical protein